ncbi:unnamed protein product [Peronospora destructor]|uniref:Reverse transcriptase Ty1/copia-type domain-containing protein n=1 Tax=Peronospora destructor TaxID=86335 RepID=A0AAV0TF06_9STRA|nr:unnamed protein product [Peronospora destructor]
MATIRPYVDDLLATGTSQERVDDMFDFLTTLQIKDLGVVSKFLGMRITHSVKFGYELDQEVTIAEMRLKFGLQDAHSAMMPIGLDHDNNTREADALLPKESTVGSASMKKFQSIVGSLLWLARCTRPDIAYAVHRATRRNHAPTTNDWQLSKRIARYLKGTMNVKLRIGQRDAEGKAAVQITSTSDADFAGDKTDRKSVSGAIFRVDGMMVGWTCRKQATVSLSTMKAEFTSAPHAGQELLALRKLLSELGFMEELPMKMEMDNQAAIRQMENEESSARAKHIDIKLNFMKDYAKNGIIKPIYVSTEMMAADLLTKAFSAPRLQVLMKMCSLYRSGRIQASARETHSTVRKECRKKMYSPSPGDSANQLRVFSPRSRNSANTSPDISGVS